MNPCSTGAGPFRIFQQFFHFGLSYHEIKDRIQLHNPDIVGISNLFSPYYRESLEVARLVKELDKDICVVLGGANTVCDLNSLNNSPFVDYIVQGEGEESFVQLIQYLIKKD